VRETERATGSKITLDDDGCISSIEAIDGSREAEVLRSRLVDLHQAQQIFYVGVTGMSRGSWTMYAARRVGMRLEMEHEYYTWGASGRCDRRMRTSDQAAVLTHELLGHLWLSLVDPTYVQQSRMDRENAATSAQNLYHAAANLEVRCRYQ
jgi:hypothetical protein